MPKKERNLKVDSEIFGNILRLNDLLKTQILGTYNNSVFIHSAFSEVMILLRDLISKAELYFDYRILEDHDVNKTKDVENVSDLIIYMRNAVCHLESENNKINGSRFKFFRFYNNHTVIEVNGYPVQSKYNDDIGYCFGKTDVILQKTHFVYI